MSGNQQKQMTIDDLAVNIQAGFKNAKDDNETLARMMAKGFNEVSKQFIEVKQDIKEIRQDLSEVKNDISAVKSNLNNYLELSEKRYVELKQRDVMLAKWIKLAAKKIGVPVDVSQLEKIYLKE